MSKRLHLVTLDHFYSQVHSPVAREFFSKLMLLRAQGYGPDYPASFLPVDTSDYIGVHHLFCLEERGELIPVGGFRQIPFNRCEYHGIQVPFLKTAEDAGSKTHLKAIDEIRSKHRRNNTSLVYSAGLTIRKEDRINNKELAQLIKELYVALTYADMIERNFDAYISYAVLRFKVQEWYPKVGYQFVEHQGEPLPPLEKHSAGGEKVSMIYMDKATPWAESIYQNHKATLDSRLSIGSFKLPETKKAA